MLGLRDYQRDCLRAIREGVRSHVSRQLVSLPTGTGKTVIFAYRIKEYPGRSLVLVHRDELLTQAQDKLLTVWPDAQVGIVKAERNELDAQVIIASVQTLSRESRLKQLRNISFGLLVTDEAHHAVAASYRRVYDALLWDKWQAQGLQLHLGLTATPNRADRRGLKEVYQKVVYHKSLLDMMRVGWLCDLRCLQVKTQISLDAVHTRRGDFAGSELASVINTENRNELIVEAYKEHAPGRLTLCFTVDVQHAHDLAEAFVEEGIKAVPLSGKTPIDQRRDTLRRFHRREIDVICNCQLLTEGYDEPAIDCIILARPTKSSGLYTQMIGRGTRVFPGKADCLIMDVADAGGRHRIIQLPDLVGLEKKPELDAKETLTQLQDRERVPAVYGKGLGISTSEVDLFGKSRLRWMAIDDMYLVNLGDAGKIKVMPSRSYPGRYVIFHELDHKGGYLSPRPVSLSWALGIGDAEAEKITGGHLHVALKDAPWRGEPASEKQLRTLRAHKASYEPHITKGQAHDIIAVLFERRSRAIEKTASRRHFS